MFPFPLMRWQSFVDFVVLSAVIYWLLNWSRKTRVLRLFLGIGGLVITGSLASRLGLIVTAWVLHVAAIAAVVMLVVVYYAEIRQALTHLDPFKRLIHFAPSGQIQNSVAIAEAAFALASIRCGALIVLTGEDSFENMVTGGTTLGGAISREILEAIFHRTSPVHDGAVIIDGDRISWVGVFLPLTQREDLPNHYGTRHRAAIGLAEQSDAKVIVVSEERGVVSLAEGTTVRIMENTSQLVQEMQKVDFRPSLPSVRGLLSRLFGNFRLKLSAVGLAALTWAVVFMTGASVRTFTIPIEFENVPAGLEISDPSTNVLAVQLRAATRLFDILDESQLVARVDLRGMNEGFHRITVQDINFLLPPGISLERTVPDTLRVLLAPRQSANARERKQPVSPIPAKERDPGTTDEAPSQATSRSETPSETETAPTSGREKGTGRAHVKSKSGYHPPAKTP